MFGSAAIQSFLEKRRLLDPERESLATIRGLLKSPAAIWSIDTKSSVMGPRGSQKFFTDHEGVRYSVFEGFGPRHRDFGFEAKAENVDVHCRPKNISSALFYAAKARYDQQSSSLPAGHRSTTE